MYKNNEIIALTPFGNNLKVNYKYSEYYKRLQLIPKQSDIPDGAPEIICPLCMRDKFWISYGDYKCIANCECGHSMTIYDG